jgi:Arc/MetJ-type ribon-helix-helix transcriptional regulator
MSTTIRLSPHGEQLLREQLSAGPYRSAEEVIERALESLAHENSRRNGSPGPAKKSASEAIADMMELRKNLTLGGLKIKDLINEGRKH